MFHSAPGADFVWNEIFLFVSAVRDRSSPEARFVSEKIIYVKMISELYTIRAELRSRSAPARPSDRPSAPQGNQCKISGLL